jgi:hypothetical protein
VLFGVAPSIAIGPVDTATAPLLQRLLPSSSTQLEKPVPIPR